MIEAPSPSPASTSGPLPQAPAAQGPAPGLRGRHLLGIEELDGENKVELVDREAGTPS